MNTTKTYQLFFVLAILLLGSPAIMAQNSSAPIDREFSGKTHGEARPFLGVFLTDHETIDVSGEETTVKKMEGVKVDGVIPNTSAEKAGLKEGDIILKINGVTTNTMESLTTELKKLKVNGGATIDYKREGVLQTTSAILMPYNEETVMAYKKQKYGDKEEYNPHKEHHHHHKMMQEHAEIRSNKPFLGVVVVGLNEEIAQEKGLAVKTGLYLKEVVKESSAEKAGLQAGDVVTSFNGASVNSHDELIEALKSLKVNDQVKIEYIRNNQTLSSMATLGQRTHTSNGYGHGHHNMHKKNHCSNGAKAKETNSNKALLGVYAVAMDASIAEEKDIRKVEGLYLKKVIEGSAADEAGLQQGDVLLSVNKVEVYSHQDLIKQLASFEAGDVVDLRFRRDNKSEKTKATLKANNETNHKSWSSCYNKSSCSKSTTTTRTTVDDEERVFIREVEIEDAEGNKTWVKVMMMEPAKEENAMLNNALEQEGKATASKQATEKMSNLNLQALTFSPNPNRGQFSLSFDMPERGNTLVRIADTAGKVVFEENLGDFEGTYHQKIDISENYKGLYFLQVVQGDKVMTKKIVVQ